MDDKHHEVNIAMSDHAKQQVLCIKPVSLLGPPKPHVVPSLEAAPLPTFDYDSIDVYKTYM